MERIKKENEIKQQALMRKTTAQETSQDPTQDLITTGGFPELNLPPPPIPLQWISQPVGGRILPQNLPQFLVASRGSLGHPLHLKDSFL